MRRRSSVEERVSRFPSNGAFCFSTCFVYWANTVKFPLTSSKFSVNPAGGLAKSLPFRVAKFRMVKASPVVGT